MLRWKQLDDNHWKGEDKHKIVYLSLKKKSVAIKSKNKKSHKHIRHVVHCTIIEKSTGRALYDQTLKALFTTREKALKFIKSFRKVMA